MAGALPHQAPDEATSALCTLTGWKTRLQGCSAPDLNGRGKLGWRRLRLEGDSGGLQKWQRRRRHREVCGSGVAGMLP